MRARRAFLYVPGDDTRKIAKATTLDVDCVCLDMEDGVALQPEGRGPPPSRPRCASSTSAARSGWRGSTRPAPAWKRRTWRPVPQAVPTASSSPRSPAQTRFAGPARRSRPRSSATAGPRRDSPHRHGRNRARHRQPAGDRGRGSPAAGAHLRRGGPGRRHGRGAHARRVGRCSTRACGGHARGRGSLQAIDMVYIDYGDTEGLVRESIRAAQMGYAGKQVIHPSQIAPVQDALALRRGDQPRAAGHAGHGRPSGRGPRRARAGRQDDRHAARPRRRASCSPGCPRGRQGRRYALVGPTWVSAPVQGAHHDRRIRCARHLRRCRAPERDDITALAPYRVQ